MAFISLRNSSRVCSMVRVARKLILRGFYFALRSCSPGRSVQDFQKLFAVSDSDMFQ